jgi:hypothetical protein
LAREIFAADRLHEEIDRSQVNYPLALHQLLDE